MDGSALCPFLSQRGTAALVEIDFGQFHPVYVNVCASLELEHCRHSNFAVSEHGFRDFRILTFREFPSFRVSESPSFRVSEFPSFRISEFPNFRISEFRSLFGSSD